MRVPAEVKAKVMSVLKDCIKLAEAHYNEKFPMPNVTYVLTGCTAGTYDHRTNTIDLNAAMMMENLDNDFIEDTVPHEFAHQVDRQINPENFETHIQFDRYGRPRRSKRSVHGPSFKFILGRVLGRDPTRCHNYDVSSVKKKMTTYTYQCSCGCGSYYEMSAKAHNKVRRGAVYWLKGAQHGRAPLVYVGTRAGTTQAPTPVVKPASPIRPTPRPTIRPASNGQSTKDIARKAYAETNSRAEFISTLESHGIKKTTASTYYQNFKSKMWS